MSTMSLDVTAVRPRRLLPWATMLGGLVTGVAIGVLTAESFFATPTDPKANVNVSLSQPVAVPEPVTLEIVPASIIETNPQFFFGTGDGSNGYYSERPIK
jgi:hypothetical protein